MIELVGFDGDDTLWHSQGFFDQAQAAFEAILGRYINVADSGLHARILATEQANLALYGYGAKAMTLSMLETAVAVTDGRIAGADIEAILALGREVLRHPVELLPGIRAAVETVAAEHEVVLVTKGDLFHQERKVAQCGLADLFRRIEIVSEKDAATYGRVLSEFEVAPANFAMVGNSLRSDIEPVLRLGGWGVHLPYASTWAHELQTTLAADDPRMVVAATPAQVPAALARLKALAGA
jgi:putative hydrolase of the HAD superfamily